MVNWEIGSEKKIIFFSHVNHMLGTFRLSVPEDCCVSSYFGISEVASFLPCVSYFVGIKYILIFFIVKFSRYL